MDTTPEAQRAYRRAWQKKNAAKVRSYKFKYRQKHRERLLLEETAWREANRELSNVRSRRYAKANPEKVKISQARHNKMHRDSRRKIEAAWRHKNPEKVAVIKARRRARKIGVEVENFTAEQLAERWALFDNRCAYCGDAATQKDHFVPISKGGSHSLKNLVPACRSCNSSKKDADPWLWLSKRAVSLSNKHGCLSAMINAYAQSRLPTHPI